MMFAALVEILIALWWVAITSTASALIAVRAVWLGAIPKVAGGLGAAALGFFAASYWLDIVGLTPSGSIDMRRGAALVLWPAVGFVVVCLIRKSSRRPAP